MILAPVLRHEASPQATNGLLVYYNLLMQFHIQAADKLNKLKRCIPGVVYTSSPYFIVASCTEFGGLFCIDLIVSGNWNNEIDSALCFRQNQMKKIVKFKLSTDIATWVQTNDSVIY